MSRKLYFAFSKLSVARYSGNIGLTGVARDPEAPARLLAALRSLHSRLSLSTLPPDYAYRTALNEYLERSIGLLKEAHGMDRVMEETGMQAEQLSAEVACECDLLEAIEGDRSWEANEKTE